MPETPPRAARPLLARLRERTRRGCERLARLPFPQGLAAGTAPTGSLEARDACQAFLAAELSRQLGGPAPSPPLAPAPEAGEPLLSASLFAFEGWQASLDTPAALLGYAYAFSGPAAALWQAGSAPPALHEERNTGTLTDAEADAVIDAGGKGMEALHRLVSALAPLNPRPLSACATLLNSAAGSHTLPEDPAELCAALRAGERSRREFPYYEARYGERGRQFTQTDSAWLVTLADLPPDAAHRQVEWLARVLSSRGMPRWLLERHLETLHAELAAALPGRAGRFDVLQEAAEALRGQRLLHLSQDAFDTLRSTFDARVAPAERAALGDTGALLAAALADEADGIPLASARLVEWLTDAERFGPEWIAAVHRTLADGRALLTPTR